MQKRAKKRVSRTINLIGKSVAKHNVHFNTVEKEITVAISFWKAKRSSSSFAQRCSGPAGLRPTCLITVPWLVLLYIVK